MKLASDFIKSARSEQRLQDNLITVDETRRLTAFMKRKTITKNNLKIAVTRMIGR